MPKVSDNQRTARQDESNFAQQGMEGLRTNGMMAHLLDALEQRQEIGHYGRLVFAMVARHFLDEAELQTRLCMNPGFDEPQAKALIRQVQSRDYNPPRPERIRAWQQEQEFLICPTDDPDACNVYRDLKFPEQIYEHIQEYQEKKVQSEQSS